MPTRYATAHDIPRIVGLAAEEHAMSPWREMPFDADAAADMARTFISQIGMTLLVSPSGYLAGQIQCMGFSRRLMAIEYAWFAKDGSGLHLLRAFEEWAKNMGADQVVVSDLISGGRLSRTLMHKKYRNLGRTLVRNLGA